FGGSSSGRTTDSDSVNLGSNPSPPAKNTKGPRERALSFVARICVVRADHGYTSPGQKAGRTGQRSGGGTMRRLLLAVIALLSFTATARAEWLEASSDHFVIYGDQGAKAIREFADRLERFHAGMSVILRR